MTVRGKVVIITGGAQGVGRFVGRTFAAEGANLAIADVAPLETVVGEVEQLGADVLPVKTDVTNERQVQSLMDQVYRRWGASTCSSTTLGSSRTSTWGRPAGPGFGTWTGTSSGR